MDDEANFGVEKNWKHATGIVASRGETNSAFAARNYKVKCRTTGAVIAVIGGYHLWWCNPHHQPLAWCDKARIEEQARASEREMCNWAHSSSYERGKADGQADHKKLCLEYAFLNKNRQLTAWLNAPMTIKKKED